MCRSTWGDAVRPDRIASGTLAGAGPDGWFDRTAFPLVPRVLPVWVFGAERTGRAGILYPGYKLVPAVRDRRTESVKFPETRVDV